MSRPRLSLRRWLLDLAPNLGLALVSVVIVFVVTEAVLRRMAPNERKYAGRLYDLEWNRDYARPRMLPHARAVHRGIPITTNSYGLRDSEIVVPKPPGVYRILMVGDSFTFGQGIPLLSQTIPKQLEARLRSAGESRAEVINFGVCGLNTFEELMSYVQQGRRLEPDRVVLLWVPFDHDLNGYRFGDLADFLEHRSLPRNPGAVGTPPPDESTPGRWMSLRERWKNTYTVLYFGRRIKSVLIKMGFNPNRYEEAEHNDTNSEGYRLMFASLRSFAAICKEQGVGFEVAIFPGLQSLDSNYYYDLIYSKIEAFCRSEGIACCDLFPAFRGRNPARLHVSIFDAHPNVQADSIAAEALAACLRPRLAETAAPPASENRGAAKSDALSRARLP